MTGFDYETRIAPAALIAAGCTDVFRYVTDPSWPKSIGAVEYAELVASGRRVWLNDETSADFMLGGYNAGVQQAQVSRARATALGVDRIPATAWWNPKLIAYSLDIQASPAQIAIALDFLHGAADADGRENVAAYGEYDFVKAALDAGFYGWDTTAWSRGQKDPRAFAWQTGRQLVVGGVQVDVNDMNPVAFGGPTASGGSDVNLSDSLGPISAGMAALVPDDGTEGMGAGATYTVAAALTGTAERTAETLILVKQLIARAVPAAPVVDVVALAAALAPHLTAGATPDEVAAAVVKHLGADLANG